MHGCGSAEAVVSEAAEAFLRSFHARDPGVSTRVFARGKDESGVSGYQRLAQTIPTTGDNVTVRDLACGDGYLLELLRERLGPFARFIGVDISTDELTAARAVRHRKSASATVACGR
jgi:SAM-dependent methyltransferase